MQVTTNPIKRTNRVRRYVPMSEFVKEKIVLWWIAGIHEHGYACQDLLKAISEKKIIIFEGFSRLKKLQSILDTKKLHYMVAGVLPPGKTIPLMLSRLKTRLLSRPGFSEEDIKRKLQEAELRVIPEVLKEADIIIRSGWNHTDRDVAEIMKKWEEIKK